MSSIVEFAKKLVFRYTSLGVPKYSYGVEPIQLASIINAIEKARAAGPLGAIVEIGVARGLTSRFITEHIIKQDLDTTFYCIDTFASFTEDDIKYEVENRNKVAKELYGFAYNDYDIWKKNFSEFKFVKPIQADAGKFDFADIGPVSVCFLDVDLYVPTSAVLNNIRPHMTPGGTVLVDDVQDNNKWDGSYQAFFEFGKESGLPHRVIGNKCGVVDF